LASGTCVSFKIMASFSNPILLSLCTIAFVSAQSPIESAPSPQATPEVVFWGYKVQAEVTLDYTLYDRTGVNHSLTDNRDAVSIAHDTEIVMAQSLTLNESQYSLYADVGFAENNQILINITMWTSSRVYYEQSQDFIKSDQFEQALTMELEANYLGLKITGFESKIVLTYNADGEGFSWSDWLDFAEYSMFQWIVVGSILFVVLIGFCCVCYCCLCQSPRKSEPYNNIKALEFAKANSRSEARASGDVTTFEDQDQEVLSFQEYEDLKRKESNYTADTHSGSNWV